MTFHLEMSIFVSSNQILFNFLQTFLKPSKITQNLIIFINWMTTHYFPSQMVTISPQIPSITFKCHPKLSKCHLFDICYNYFKIVGKGSQHNQFLTLNFPKFNKKSVVKICGENLWCKYVVKICLCVPMESVRPCLFIPLW